ncbi:MAG TPA: hypothetical protein VIR29_05070 [Anseongella sp.]
MLYSNWFPASWNYNNQPDYKQLRVTESMLTTDFLSKGVVLVYYISVRSFDGALTSSVNLNNYDEVVTALEEMR